MKKRLETVEDLEQSYWYLKDLVQFCRAHGIDPSGRKLDLLGRIEAYLKTGVSAAPQKAGKKIAAPHSGPLTLDTPVTANFKCDAETRALFQSVIGERFHFTAHLQQFRRAHKKPLTYGDLAREWVAEFERRKDKTYKPKIERTGQWNQFVRDFMADKARNAGKSIRDAAQAWTLVRDRDGPKTYAEFARLRIS